MSSPEPLCGAQAGFTFVRFFVLFIITNRFPYHRTAWTPRPEYSHIAFHLLSELKGASICSNPYWFKRGTKNYYLIDNGIIILWILTSLLNNIYLELIN